MKVSPETKSNVSDSNYLKACHSAIKVPLSFSSKSLETAFQRSVTKSISNVQTLIFYLGYALTMAIYISLSIYTNLSCDVSSEVRVSQLSLLCGSFLISSLLLYLFSFKKYYEDKNKFILIGLYCFIFLSLALSSNGFLAEVFEDTEDVSALSPVTGLIILIPISTLVLIVTLRVFLITNAVLVSAYLALSLVHYSVPMALAETTLICLVIFLTYKEFRGREHSARSRFIKNTQFERPEAEKPEQENNVFRTDLEQLLMTVFECLDTVSSIKNTSDKLEKVKRMLGQAMTILTSKDNIYDINIDNLTKNMDENDRIFIQESYSNQQVIPMKTSLIRTKKTVEISKHREVEESFSMLRQIGKNWNFDMFFLNDCCNGDLFPVVGAFIFEKYSLPEVFTITSPALLDFLSKLQDTYMPNPYHNEIHAADVMASFMFLVNRSELANSMLSYEIMGSIIACLGHDSGHPGLNNRFLINDQDDLAIRYNDISVLESMHCCSIFEILKDEKANILKHLERSTWAAVRKLIIEIILATDMSRHFDLLGHFRARALTDTDFDSSENRAEIIKIAVKAADIGHTAKHQDMHERWSMLIIEEFYTQGDLEKQRGMKVSMYCDRDKNEVCKSQMGFIKNIAMPLFEILNKFLVSSYIQEQCIEQLATNYSGWEYWQIKKVFENKTSLNFGKELEEDQLSDKKEIQKKRKGGTLVHARMNILEKM